MTAWTSGAGVAFTTKGGSMLKEFVEKLLSLAPTARHQIHGREYADRAVVLVEPPRSHAPLELITLTGLVDAVRAKLDDLDLSLWVLEVVSYKCVRVVSRLTDAYGAREVLLVVDLTDGEVFPFGRFLPREEFVIGLQSRFVHDNSSVDLLKTVSSLETSVVALSEDDGISQKTTVKQGIALKETITVKGRVKLRPFRTFREVEQPLSEFVFRLRSKDGTVPECALFEADGGAWKLDAVLTIKHWLEAKQLGLPVVA